MEEKTERISSLASRVIALAHDDILMHLRFFDMPLARLRPGERPGIDCCATDGTAFFYDPRYVLKRYREDPHYITRVFLHTLLHCIFSHGFQYDRMEEQEWDLAADIAVENIILELGLPGTALERDRDALRKLAVLREDVGPLTAERIYRYFRHNPLTPAERAELH